MKKILIASILFASMNTIFLPCSSAVSINSPVESIQEPRYEQITNINYFRIWQGNMFGKNLTERWL